VQHYSVFALAPQPLLIRLGTLLSDIYSTDVMQLHREPKTWRWQSDSTIKDFQIFEPQDKTGIPVLLFSLSGTVTDNRIIDTIGKKCSIWRLTISSPHNDFFED
jgi:hypothetical protein